MNNNISPVSFQAKYIGETTVLKRNILYYSPKKVSLVELDRDSEADIENLKNLIQSWNTKLISGLLRFKKPKEEKILCVTTQKNNFEKLNPNKILGIMQYFDKEIKNSIEINKIQVNPKYTYKKNPFENITFINNIIQFGRTYKSTGTSLVNEIKKNCNNKIITLFSISDSIPFYEKNGFKHIKGTCSQSMTFK